MDSASESSSTGPSGVECEIREQQLKGVLRVLSLLFQKLEAVPSMLRGSAEKGVVEAFKQWCQEAGHDEVSALKRLSRQVGKSL